MDSIFDDMEFWRERALEAEARLAVDQRPATDT